MPATLTLSNGTVVTNLTLQQAVAQADNGSSIVLTAGFYNVTSTLNINKSISITGAAEHLVTINTSSIDGVGFQITADNVSLSKFMVIGPQGGPLAGNWGIKVNPDTGAPGDTVTNFTMNDVTVLGSGRSEIDLNGVVGATLNDVTVNGSAPTA